MSALISTEPPLRNASTLEMLHSKYLPENQAAIAAYQATVFGGAQDSPATPQGTIGEVDEPFCLEDVRAVIKKATPLSAPGPYGLRFSNLQDALSDELVKDAANFTRLVLSSTHLPYLFWALPTAVSRSALGVKARQVTCGDVLPRTLSATFRRQYGQQLVGYFEPWGQDGVAVPGDVEVEALAATLGLQECCTIPSFDVASAFNSICRHRTPYWPMSSRWPTTPSTPTPASPQSYCTQWMGGRLRLCCPFEAYNRAPTWNPHITVRTL